MVSDRAVANYRANVKKVLEISDGPVLCLANMTFDIFMTEGLLPLTMGRTVVLADEEERALPWRTAKLITDSGVKTVQITPSQLRVCLGSEDFRAALKSVRLLIITGEASSRSLVDAVSDVTDAVLVDLYGPTETTVYASGSRLEKGGRVTIGKPFENCRMYVLDEKGELALPTARGELYIAGECLSDGYVNRPDLTEKAFSADPFFPGELMYRTGDLARLLTDGSFECLGRADSQVKLNGLRIELDEINGAAVQSGLVSECVTLLCRKSDGTSFLRSFAVPAAGADGGEAALRLEMGKLLPAYMIPAQFVMLDSLPVNPSGKIDMPRLSAWEAEEPAPVRAESVSSVSETLRGVWRDALERSDISDTESFFLQGGTSLAALAVLTGYYEQGLSMTLADFYAHPTLAEQEAMLKAAPAAPGANAVPKAENTAVETFVPHPAPSDVPPAPSLPARRVLVTGASGFLGAHLVRELLRCGADTVTCLMRDGDRARLLSVLVHYFGPDWGADNSWRINVVRGSVTSLRFGMPERDYAALMSCVDAVFHSAADVRHYSSDGRALDTNVAGTVNAADFASLAGVPFNHISTLSVSGEYMLRDPALAAVFTESDFDIGQNWEDNIYVRGKFLAEQAVYDRVRRGLCARVYRLGRLVGRDSDGMFQPNPKTNAVYLTLRGIQAAGAIPEAMAGQQIDLTPIDFCAGAITALSSSDMPVCHIADPAPVTMLEAVSAIKPDIRVASDGEFSALLSQAARNGRASDVAPLIEVWNRAIRSGPAKITPVWDRTTKKLRSLGAAMPASGPELRLKEYTVNFEGGKVKE
jgi:thioester reductase-like protein/aryl carrier-like protein